MVTQRLVMEQDIDNSQLEKWELKHTRKRQSPPIASHGTITQRRWFEDGAPNGD